MNYTITRDQVMNRACQEGLEQAEKAYPGWQELTLSEILESNGIMDAIWCLRFIDAPYKIELFAAEIANLGVLNYEKKYPGDLRVRKCVKATFDYIFGLITQDELKEKRNAAARAARAAARAVRAAADAVYTAASVAYAAYDAYAAYTAYADAEIKKLFIKFFC